MLMVLLVLVVLFGGCAANDKVYGVGKAVYGVGKAVAPVVPMSDGKREKLEKLDNIAGKYDEARTAVRGSQDDELDIITEEAAEATDRELSPKIEKYKRDMGKLNADCSSTCGVKSTSNTSVSSE